MTGFGVGGAPLGDGRVCFEVRSLNHRFLDVRVRLPPELGDQTFYVEQIAREELTRGRYDIGVRLEGAALPPPRLAADRVRAAYRTLAELRDDLCPGTELPLAAVLGLPELSSAAPAVDPEPVRAALSAGFREAVGALSVMREREGAALARELGGRLDTVKKLARDIGDRGPELTRAGHERDTGRLETELALLADKTDVTEELVRLESHAAQFHGLLSARDPVGRRLDFLLQEMGREVNTIGSKCQDSAVAHQVVELKSELERMREQVQNVE
jgi:uncharacterized protein (TIGR00255 family)